MKIAAVVARFFLALIFIVMGLNGFLQFIPVPPLPQVVVQFMTVMTVSGYMAPIFALQIACGLLFLINRYIPLALTLIGPVIVNILLFHVLMQPAGIGPGVLTALCWFIVFYTVRDAFAGIFRARS